MYTKLHVFQRWHQPTVFGSLYEVGENHTDPCINIKRHHYNVAVTVENLLSRIQAWNKSLSHHMIANFKSSIHCKNTWVTSTTFLGCLSCTSVLKECYQIGFRECSLWSFFSCISIVSLQNIYLATLIPGISTATMQPRSSSRGRCVHCKKI